MVGHRPRAAAPTPGTAHRPAGLRSRTRQEAGLAGGHGSDRMLGCTSATTSPPAVASASGYPKNEHGRGERLTKRTSWVWPPPLMAVGVPQLERDVGGPTGRGCDHRRLCSVDRRGEAGRARQAAPPHETVGHGRGVARVDHAGHNHRRQQEPPPATHGRRTRLPAGVVLEHPDLADG